MPTTPSDASSSTAVLASVTGRLAYVDSEVRSIAQHLFGASVVSYNADLEEGWQQVFLDRAVNRKDHVGRSFTTTCIALDFLSLQEGSEEMRLARLVAEAAMLRDVANHYR